MSNVREFIAGERIQWSIGTNGLDTVLFGPFTIAAIVRRLGTPAEQGALLNFGVASDNSRGFFRYTDIDLMNYLRGQFQSPGDGPAWASTQNWTLVAFTKIVGTVPVRYHRYIYDTNIWVHTDSSGTVDNEDNVCTLIENRFQEGAGSVFRGRYATLGVWDRVLSDSEIEGLKDNYSAWLDALPIELFKFNQDSTSISIDGQVGDSVQVVLVGSTVVDDIDLQFNFEGSQVFEPILLGSGSLADQMMAGLISQGFTSGSLADRERARLLAKLVLVEPQNLSIQDLYRLANEPNRIAG